MEVFASAKSNGPIVQLCVDVRSLPDAISVSKMGLRAGVDWLELGTPLVSWVGLNALEVYARVFGDTVKFLDAKVMDASAPYIEYAAKSEMQLVCLCASASDATFRAAVDVAKPAGIKVVGDLYAVADPMSRAQQLVELGVDAIYLHYGYDQQNEDLAADPTIDQLAALRERVDVPIGIVTPNVEAGERAAGAGADVLLVSHPFLIGLDAEPRLADYVDRVKASAAG